MNDNNNPRGLSDRAMERFHQHAANALAGRTREFYVRELSRGLNIVFVGALPIAGMVFFGWSAIDLMVYLLVGLWFGIISDGYKLTMLNKQINNAGEKYFDNMYVWATVDTIRNGRSEANQQQRNAKYSPEMGCFIDLVFGGIGMVVMVAGTAEKGLYLFGNANRSVLVWAFGLGVLRMLMTLREVQIRSRKIQIDPPTVACGVRGVGLFLMMFLVLMVADHAKENDQLAKITMITINGIVVGYGLLTISSYYFLQSETRWLREYLEKRDQEVAR